MCEQEVRKVLDIQSPMIADSATKTWIHKLACLRLGKSNSVVQQLQTVASERVRRQLLGETYGIPQPGRAESQVQIPRVA